GATPVFADVRRDGLIDPDAVAAAVTPRTAAVMPVHLWGGICDMEALWAIAERHGLAIVEDAAQAMGTRYRNRRAGSLGTVGCFSAHPSRFSTLSVMPASSRLIRMRLPRAFGYCGIMVLWTAIPSLSLVMSLGSTPCRLRS